MKRKSRKSRQSIQFTIDDLARAMLVRMRRVAEENGAPISEETSEKFLSDFLRLYGERYPLDANMGELGLTLEQTVDMFGIRYTG